VAQAILTQVAQVCIQDLCEIVGKMDAKPPLVLVHGLKGSHLVEEQSGKRRYCSVRQLLKLENDQFPLPMRRTSHGAQESDGLQAKSIIKEIKLMSVTLATFYGPFVREFATSRNLHIFVYDWRRELAESSQKLEDFLDAILKEGQRAQMVCHSMGALITLPLLNRRPELFNSVLLAAPATGPDISCLRDMSEVGQNNQMGPFNSTMMTPWHWLTWTSGTHFLPSTGDVPCPGTDAFLEEHDGIAVPVDFHNIEDWRRLQLGAFHPNSGVGEITKEVEEFFTITLQRAKHYRELLRFDPRVAYPHIAILLSDDTPTPITLRRQAPNMPFDFENYLTVPGDGRVATTARLVPEGVPVLEKRIIKSSHSTILCDDLGVVHELLAMLLEKSDMM
jgi:pimeloyl-ACP methyl ester carboxylesterase